MKRKWMKLSALSLLTTFLLGMTIGLSGCANYCQHELITHEKVAATCQTDGTRAYYECEKCHKLFGYTDAKGIYEISQPEVAPMGDHTIGVMKGGVTTAKKKAEGLDDYVMQSTCSVCQKTFDVDSGSTIAFAPSTDVAYPNGGSSYVSASHIKEGETVATAYTLKAGTPANTRLQIWRTGDDGNYNANTNVPFSANKDRYLVMFMQNSSDKDVEIEYGSECYDVRCKTKATLKAKSVTAFLVTINHDRSDPGSVHELDILQTIGSDTTITAWGYYYAVTKYTGIELSSWSKTSYTVGETLDLSDLEIVAKYTGDVEKSEVVPLEDCEIDLAGKALTEENTEVVITYKKKKLRIPITVTKEGPAGTSDSENGGE